HIGHHPVADAQHARAVDGAAQQAFRLFQRQGVDGGERLARHDHPPAHRLVQISDGAAAIDDRIPALHHAIGVGADQLQSALGRRRQTFAIVLGRLGGVVIRPGDGNEGGVFGAVGAGQVQAFIQGEVAIRADDPGRAGRAARQLHPGGVARGDKGLPGAARHAQTVQLRHHVRRRARRVRDQDDMAALLVELGQGVAGGGPALAPVVDHAPDVAEQDIVVIGDGGQAGQRMRLGHAPLIASESGGERPGLTIEPSALSLFAAARLPANRLDMKISRLALGAYGIALAVIILDQLTKAWVLGAIDAAHISYIPDGYRIAEVAPPVLNLTYVLNTGVSFGLFGGGAGRWILSIFSVVVAGLLAWWATRANRRLLVAAIGLVMGGAVGNVIDRIRFGGVVDFLDFSGTGLFPWIFNVADSGITVGVMLLILDSFLSERRTTVGAAHEKS